MLEIVKRKLVFTNVMQCRSTVLRGGGICRIKPLIGLYGVPKLLTGALGTSYRGCNHFINNYNDFVYFLTEQQSHILCLKYLKQKIMMVVWNKNITIIFYAVVFFVFCLLACVSWSESVDINVLNSFQGQSQIQADLTQTKSPREMYVRHMFCR